MIKELHKKLIKKETTSSQLVKECFEKIKKDNNRLNAFLDTYEEEALQKAGVVDEKISKGEKPGLLEGIPCAVKDNFCIAGKRTTAASKILENYISPYNSTVIEKLSNSGVIFSGKTNLDEFAMGASTEHSAFGVTKNPYDENRVAGGSSGGSAAAVATGMSPWALGSDTGGSIRQPSGFCGVVGMKPTYGRVSRYGLIAMASSYDQIGPITANVEDAAIVLDEICGEDPKDNTTTERSNIKKSFSESLNGNLAGKKIGVVKEFFGQGLDGNVKKIIEERISWAEKQGAELVEVELPYVKYSLAVYYLMVPSEVSSNMARYDGIKYGFSEAVLADSKSKDLLDVYLKSRKAGIGPEVKRRIILGTYALSAGYYDAYYKKAQIVRELIKKDFSRAFEKVDVLVSPTSPSVAFKIGEKTDNPLEMYLADIYTAPINVAGIPAISIPADPVEVEGRKLPVGLQVIGKWWDEQTVLDVAKGLEV